MLRFRPVFKGAFDLILNKNGNINLLKLSQTRNIFNPQNYMPSFESDRKLRMEDKFSKDFKEKMKTQVRENENSVIFLDNIKKFIYLVDNDSDLEFLSILIKRYFDQTNILRFQNLALGPLVIRLYYVLNKPKEALDLVKSFDTTPHFKESVTFTILSGLLFKNEMYEDIIDLFHWIRNQQIQGRVFIRPVTSLYFAACYKLNTPESFADARESWSRLNEAGVKTDLNTISLFSMLALKQNNPSIAINVFYNIDDFSFGVIVKCLVLSMENQLENVVETLKKFLKNENIKPKFIPIDVLETLEKYFESTDEILKKKFNDCIKAAKLKGVIEDKTLDSYLLALDPVLEKPYKPSKVSFIRREQRSHFVSTDRRADKAS